MVLLHAYTVAEDGSAGDAASGVYGQDGDCFVLGSKGQREGVYQRAFTCSRGARDSYDAGVAFWEGC
jgi:hypothetical protein